MTTETLHIHTDEEDALRYDVSDEEMEAAAAETAMSYTHQTSAYNRCCR